MAVPVMVYVSVALVPCGMVTFAGELSVGADGTSVTVTSTGKLLTAVCTPVVGS